MFQNTELNAAHHLCFLVETLWSPKTMSLIKIPKVWVSMTAIIFCLCILWKACITWHFWATNRKLTFSWKITPLGAIPPLKSLAPARSEGNFRWVILKPILIYRWLMYLLWNCSQINITGPYWWHINIGSVMAWCRQATSHYLSQCWPRSMSPYGHNEISPNHTCPFLLTPMMPDVASCGAVTKMVSPLMRFM